MALVSMKTSSSPVDCCSTNEYGYGTQIMLNEDQCKALGLTSPLPAGSKVMISAAAFVQSATERADKAGDGDATKVCMSLQITDMELQGEEKRSREQIAESLYGGKK